LLVWISNSLISSFLAWSYFWSCLLLDSSSSRLWSFWVLWSLSFLYYAAFCFQISSSDFNWADSINERFCNSSIYSLVLPFYISKNSLYSLASFWLFINYSLNKAISSALFYSSCIYSNSGNYVPIKVKSIISIGAISSMTLVEGIFKGWKDFLLFLVYMWLDV
jgi:hypothetical protein